MEPLFWLFQRDEIDVLETEIDALWNRHMRRGKGVTAEEAVLKEYADTEERAETDLLLRAGEPAFDEQEEEPPRAFEELPVADFLRRGAVRDPLYVRAYDWSRRAGDWTRHPDAPRPHAFRARVNALLVPVKLACAQFGETHEGRAAREAALSDYALALRYVSRAAESLARAEAGTLVDEADAVFREIEARRAAVESGTAGV